MSFTDAEKVAIRRHMGYPAFGAGENHGFQSWRFFQAYGTLEFRLNNLSAEEEGVVRTYTTRCDQLETDILKVADNVDTASAAVWTRNPYEMQEREQLFRNWRLRLCQFFDLPPGPGLQGGGRNVSLVV